MSTILITGAKGLIGSLLGEMLEQEGYQIRPFDFRYSQDDSRYGDILDISQVTRAMAGCVGVIHLAAVSRVLTGEQMPRLCWNTNVCGTDNILKAALATETNGKHPWVIFSSSREVYGKPLTTPVSIDAPYRPMNIYAYTKVEAEKTVLKARERGLNTAVVRFSNVYGSIHDHETRVIPAFCRRAVLNQPLYIEGANRSADFTHVKDTVMGTVKIVRLLESGKKFLLPLHLTTSHKTTLYELARMATKAANSSAVICEKEGRSFDVPEFCGAIDEVSRLLNWQPLISIEEGITELVNDFKNHFATLRME